MESDSPVTPKQERSVRGRLVRGGQEGPLPTSTELLNSTATLKKRRLFMAALKEQLRGVLEL